MEQKEFGGTERRMKVDYGIERRTRVHFGTEKNEGAVRDRKDKGTRRNCTFNFHWLLLIDSTEKLRVHSQTDRQEMYLCVYLCVLKCTAPALLLFCDTQSQCGSNDGVMMKNDK